MNPVKLAADRWLVQTTCHDCFIGVETSAKDDDWKWVTVGLLPCSPTAIWNSALRRRLQTAWRILRGGSYLSFEMITSDEIDALLVALKEARTEAFSPPPPEVAPTRPAPPG